MLDIIPDGWSIVGVGDFNGDGHADILLRNSSGVVTDWLGSSDGTFTQNDPATNGAAGPSWQVVGTGDFSGSGHDDILWRNGSGLLTDWLSSGTGTFTPNGASTNGSADTSWQVAGTGDFNGDGITDILWRNASGLVTDWLGNTDGSFTPNSAATNGSAGTSWQIVGTGDFNGDGRSDILWRNADGTIVEWLGQSNGGFADSGANNLASPGVGWNVAGVGDLNGDHRADVLWRKDDGTITDWLGQADGSFVDNSSVALQPVSTDLQIAGIGDFNGDGRADVLWRGSSGNIETWTGAADGTVLSPVEKLWHDALANVSEFFDELTNQIGGASPTPTPPDQVSSYDMGENYAPFDTAFLDMWGWLPTVRNDPAAHYWDFLTQNVDPEFQLTGLTGSGFDATFDLHNGSMTQFGDPNGNSYMFSVDGLVMQGVWHANSPPHTDGTSIVVTPAGYWTFDPIAVGLNFADGHGGGSLGGSGVNSGPAGVDIKDDTPTAVEAAAAKFSVDFLYKYSPTARALIDTIGANGTKLNLITASLSGYGVQDQFDKDHNKIDWDPFMYVYGTNTNGSSYIEAPVMLLAHELIHAGHPDDPSYQGFASEALVMSIANQIAVEVNLATGSHYDTTRDNHDGQRGDTTSPTSTVVSIVRPGI